MAFSALTLLEAIRPATLADLHRLIRGDAKIDPRRFGFEVRSAVVGLHDVERATIRVPIDRLRFARSDLSPVRLRNLEGALERSITAGTGFPPVRAVYDPASGDLVLAGDGNHRLLLAHARGSALADVEVEFPAGTPLKYVRLGRRTPMPNTLTALVSRTGRGPEALDAARRALADTSRLQRAAVSEVSKIRARAIVDLSAQLRGGTAFRRHTASSMLEGVDRSMSAWAADLDSRLGGLQARAATEAIGTTLDSLGLDERRQAGVMTQVSPTLTRDVVDGMLEMRQTLIKNVTGSFRLFARTEIHAGIASGKSVSEVANALLEKSPSIGFARAEAIARTETLRAYSHASQQVAERAAGAVPGMTKSWVPIRDQRSRVSHDEMADKPSVPVTGQFTVRKIAELRDRKTNRRISFQVIGSEQMLMPRDPKASAMNSINCRCSVIYLSPDEAGE